MPRLLKKFVFSFLAGLVILFSIAPYLSPVNAQAWYSQEPIEWYLKVYDKDASPPNEIFGERYTAAQVQWVVYGFLFMPLRMIQPVIGEDIILCILKQVGAGTFDINNCGTAVMDVVTVLSGIFGKVFPLITSNTDSDKPFLALVFDTTNRDLSGIGYTKTLLNKFTLVSEVRAQGFGYTALSWIQDYWTGFRDISYGLLVMVIIIFAFMIMFRVKLSPQTVVSVQSALPKVILTLILVTFSYAIAGFAIDLMYIVSGLFAFLIKAAGFTNNINSAFSIISGAGPGYNIPLAGGLWILFMMLGYAVSFFVAALIATITSLVSSFSVFNALLGVVFMILGVFCLVIMIWYTFKIPFVLIKTLISLYISIITAPVQILAGAIIPSMGFGTWFKKVMADVLVFPVVGLFIYFAWKTLGESFTLSGYDFINFSGSASLHPISWVPGIIGTSGPTTGSISGIIFLAISFGIMAEIPKIPDMLKGMLLGEKFAFGTGIGEAMEAFGIASTAQKSLQSAGSDLLYNPKGGRNPVTGKDIATGFIPDMVARYKNRPKGSGGAASDGPVNT